MRKVTVFPIAALGMLLLLISGIILLTSCMVGIVYQMEKITCQCIEVKLQEQNFTLK